MDKQKQKAVRKAVGQEGAFVDMLNQEMKELQDSQKQIEEIARIIAFDLCPNRHVHAKWGEEAQCYSDNNFAECTKIKNVVDKLYNAGYRKIPENAVVLTKEELEERDCKNFHEGHRTGVAGTYEQVEALNAALNERNAELEEYVRKETAEKFAEMLKECVVDDFTEYEYDYLCMRIDEICKEITEGKV
jgi:hypothetical protein